MINMLDAKTSLSKLVRSIESGEQAEIVIARNGRPAARPVPVRSVAPGKRIGVAAGRFVAPDDIDHNIATIAKMFERRQYLGDRDQASSGARRGG